MVLFHHLVPGASKYAALGPLGVRLFFVMTGFLLVGNLLQQLERGKTRPSILRSFYAKRSIRILPVYILGFLAALAGGTAAAKAVWPAIATFTINFQMGLTGEWPGNLSHYWFLATSEQMVFALALIVLWLPGRYLAPALVLLFAGAWLHRWIGTEWGLTPMMVWYSPLSSMDSIAVGGLLAVFLNAKPDTVSARVRKPWVGILAGIALFLAALIRLRLSQTPLIHLSETLEALFFGWLILRAAIGFQGLTAKFLTSPALVYTGMISYALYIFHPLVHSLMFWIFAKLELPARRDNPPLIIATFLGSYLVAALSWHLMEKPLASLKPKAAPLKS